MTEALTTSKENSHSDAEGITLQGWWRQLFIIVATIFILYHVLYLSDILVMAFGLSISPYFHNGIHLSLILFFVFLLVPARKGTPRSRPPWYDIILAVIAMVPSCYYAFFYEHQISWYLGQERLLYVILGWVLIVMLLEASRRLLGWIYTGLLAIFLVYILSASYLPGVLHAPSYSLPKTGEFLYTSMTGIHGRTLGISATIIVTFLLFSQLLFVSGMGKFFIDLAFSLTGHVRGGPAKTAVVASAAFGMLSGSPSANVATTGAFTIPMMKTLGYSSAFAGAVESVASTGGQIMPPIMGSVIFIMSEFVEIPYVKIMFYAFIPACLYYLAILIMVDSEAVKLRLHGIPRDTLPRFWKTMRGGFVFIIPVVVLLYLLIGPMFNPYKACIWAIASLLVLSWFRKGGRIGPRSWVDASVKAVQSLLMVAVAVSAVGIIIGSISITGLGVRLSTELVNLSGGFLVVLLLISALTAFILGMGVGPLSCYIFLALMVAPAMIKMGAVPVSAHLFLIYWAMVSFITPPVCGAVFVASSIAKSDIMKTGWNAVRLGIAAYIVPFAFVFKPGLLLQGSPIDIILTTFLCIVGVAGLACGLGGYLFGKLTWLPRLMLLGSGFTFLFANGIYLVAGGILLAAAIIWQLVYRKTIRPLAATDFDTTSQEDNNSQ